MNNIASALFHFVDLLKQFKIRYALIGGIAVALLARERFTKDIDLTISINEKQAKLLEAYFRNNKEYKIQQLNFISSKKIPDFFRIFWHQMPVDLLVSNTDFQKELVTRARNFDFENRKIKVATVEDMIILKLIADRPMDREDIKEMIKSNRKLDWKYIEKHAVDWEIIERVKIIKKISS